MPVVPDPESLEDDQQVLLRNSRPAPAMREWVARERPFETRAVLGRGPFDAAGDRPARAAIDHIWLRARGNLPDDPNLHRALLAFVSDMSLLDTALLPHGKSIFSRCAGREPGSCHVVSPAVSAPMTGCSMCRIRPPPRARGGSIAARSIPDRGILVASVTQEGLIRRAL